MPFMEFILGSAFASTMSQIVYRKRVKLIAITTVLGILASSVVVTTFMIVSVFMRLELY